MKIRKWIPTLLLPVILGLGGCATTQGRQNPCNPCAEKKMSQPCNPCAKKNPCNPCAKKNPCNPCNPCGGKAKKSPR